MTKTKKELLSPVNLMCSRVVEQKARLNQLVKTANNKIANEQKQEQAKANAERIRKERKMQR